MSYVSEPGRLRPIPETRDFVGYGGAPPDPRWLGGARLALQIVLNYEEGGETSVTNGDSSSEAWLTEEPGVAIPHLRNMMIESQYEYGSRAGFWRIHRILTERGIPITVYGIATALAKNPSAVAAMRAAGWEIASHGLRWISYVEMPEAHERRQIADAVAIHTEATGAPPTGWYTGRPSPQTRALLVEHGGFAYDSDSIGDDLPYWVSTPAGPHLVVPYTLDNNDARFLSPFGFTTRFSDYLIAAFDALYEEGASAPKMMSVGLHNRIVGRPGRIGELTRFLDHVATRPDVWITRRIDIAEHWRAHHPPEV